MLRTHLSYLLTGTTLIAVTACAADIADTTSAASAVTTRLVWEEHLQGLDYGAVSDIEIDGGRVSATGYHLGASADFAVRTYDAGSGALAWEDLHDRAGRNDVARAVVGGGGRIYAGGYAISATANRDAVLRAYDAATGALVWSALRDSGGHDEISTQTIAADGPRVFAGGIAAPAGDTDWVVHAHRADTGELLWQSTFDGGDFDHTVALAARGGRVFSGGVTTSADVVRHFTVRANDAATGALLWEDRQPGMSGYFFATDVAWQLVAVDQQVIAAGSVGSDDGTIHFAVRAYDAATGALLWSDVVDGGAGADVAFSIAAEGNRVFVGGTGGPACSSFDAANCDIVVRAYNANTGAVMWESSTDVAGSDDQVMQVAVAGNRLAVVSAVSSADWTLDWLVQIHNAQTGAILSADQVATPGGFGIPNAVALKGNRLVVGGYGADDDFGLAWRVRAYDVR